VFVFEMPKRVLFLPGPLFFYINFNQINLAYERIDRNMGDQQPDQPVPA
jgi:hypothetical protein